MADVKVSGLPQDSSVDGGHYVILNDPAGPTTKRGFLSVLAAWFFDQLNIPAGTGSPVTRDSERQTPAVISGLAITADSVGVNRNASMTSGVIYVNGRRLSVSSVSARTYTASRDTYVDVLDNQDGTASLVYTEVTNGAASPALASNSVRIGKVVTGATTIAATSSITQLGADTLGNLIYPMRLQKISIIRQDNTTNSLKPQSILLAGWGYITINGGTNNGQKTVTLPVTFVAVPIIMCQVVSYSPTVPTGPGSSAGALGPGGITSMSNMSTSSFIVYFYQSANAGSTTYYPYTWIVIGEVL